MTRLVRRHSSGRECRLEGPNAKHPAPRWGSRNATAGPDASHSAPPNGTHPFTGDRPLAPPPLTRDAEEEPQGWPAWKVLPAALWPVAILAAYVASAVLPLLLRLGGN